MVSFSFFYLCGFYFFGFCFIWCGFWVLKRFWKLNIETDVNTVCRKCHLKWFKRWLQLGNWYPAYSYSFSHSFFSAVSMSKWIFDVKLDLLLAIDMAFVLLFAYVSLWIWAISVQMLSGQMAAFRWSKFVWIQDVLLK